MPTRTTITTAQVKDGSLTDADIATANKDGTAATPSLRTLGTGATQAAAGDHTHGSSGGSSDGWQADPATWTYASASTFTVTGNVTAMFPKGTKLKLTQTTVKYFRVISAVYSSSTTVTVDGAGTCTLANATITSPNYSYQQNPQGYPLTTPSVRAYHSANQTCPETIAAMAFNSERWDTDAIHDTSTNNTRFTCRFPGVYAIFGHCAISGSSSGTRGMAIKLNGSTYIAVAIQSVTVDGLYHSIQTQYNLAVGDYIEICSSCGNTGVGSLTTVAAGNYSAEGGMTYLGGDA